MRVMGALHHYLYPSVLAGTVLFCALELFYAAVKMAVRKEKIRVSISAIIFQYIMCVYLIGVLFVTGGYQVFVDGLPEYTMSPNLIPVVNTLQDLMGNPGEMVEQIGYNIILFLPFGFFVPFALPKIKFGWKRVLLLSAVCVVVVESLEMLSGRYFDIDDVMINSVGALLGFGIYTVLTMFRFPAGEMS